MDHEARRQGDQSRVPDPSLLNLAKKINLELQLEVDDNTRDISPEKLQSMKVCRDHLEKLEKIKRSTSNWSSR